MAFTRTRLSGAADTVATAAGLLYASLPFGLKPVRKLGIWNPFAAKLLDSEVKDHDL